MSPGGKFTPKQAEAIVARADGRCERCANPARGARGLSWSIQHRKARGMGGTSRAVTLADGVLLCGSATTGCHGYVESHPDYAERDGWRVPQYESDVARVPIRHVIHDWVLLDPDGGYVFPSRAIPTEIQVVTRRVRCIAHGCHVELGTFEYDEEIDSVLAHHALLVHPEARE